MMSSVRHAENGREAFIPLQILPLAEFAMCRASPVSQSMSVDSAIRTPRQLIHSSDQLSHDGVVDEPVGLCGTRIQLECHS
jgi:hypothetical protein